MYLSFYGLSEKPFSQTPDPKFLYWNDAYRETIASLRYGIQERKGFVTMIGEAGTGKTTLLRKLLDDLGPDVVSVFLFNPNATFEEILEYTLSELGIPSAAGRKLAMLQRLNDFLLAAFQEGKNTILIIDEAQDLETEVLESLRLLSNLETAKEKILQIVLAGQPELATRLAQPNLRQLKQRIAVRCRLEPLGRHELPDYIAARLAVAGGRPDLFAPETLDPIWTFARGIPRLVNTVCDNALLVGYALGRQTIDTEVINEVIADLTKIDAPLELPTAVVEPSIAAAPVTGSSPEATAAPPAPPVAAAPAAAPSAPASVASSPAVPPAPVAAPHPAAATTQPAPSAATAPGRVHTAAAASAERSPFTTHRGAHDGAAMASPGRRRRSGLAVAAIVVLVLAAAAAYGAARWDDVRPRLLALLGEPRDASAPSPNGPANAGLENVAPARPAPDAAPAQPSSNAVPDATGAAAAGVDVATIAGDAAAHAAVPEERSAGSDATEDAAQAAADAGSATGAAWHESQPTSNAVVAAAIDAADAAPASPPSAAANPAPDRVASVDRAAASPTASQDLQLAQRTSRGGKRVRVQLGDTLMNLVAREYGYATYTLLDVVRAANPDIQDVNRIIAGSEIVFPDPGPTARVIEEGDGTAVLVATTPVLLQAQEIQRRMNSRYQLPADLEPVAIGDGRNLYRVSLRRVPDPSQARAIAESLGTVLKDPS